MNPACPACATETRAVQVQEWSPVLAIYTGSVMLGFHLRVLSGEEPWLARTHGAALAAVSG